MELSDCCSGGLTSALRQVLMLYVPNARYAALERRLGEIDRARAIYVHASALADPKRDPGFWSEWNGFEVAHGNEDTFREMLRIRRSVAAAHGQTHFNTTIIDSAAVAPVTGAPCPVTPAYLCAWPVDTLPHCKYSASGFQDTVLCSD